VKICRISSQIIGFDGKCGEGEVCVFFATQLCQNTSTEGCRV
jgi:hypothetical protein